MKFYHYETAKFNYTLIKIASPDNRGHYLQNDIKSEGPLTPSKKRAAKNSFEFY